jgi:hypothetical protein
MKSENICYEELNKQLSEVYSHRQFFNFRSQKYMEYHQILLDDIPYILGPFAKVFCDEGKLLICGDILGENGLLIESSESGVKIYLNTLHAMRSGAKFDLLNLKPVYEGAGFLRSEMSPFIKVFRLSAFTFYRITPQTAGVEVLIHNFNWVSVITGLSDACLIESIVAGYPAPIEKRSLLYSGGLDSRLIRNLFGIDNLFNFNSDSEYEPNNRDSFGVIKEEKSPSSLLYYKPGDDVFYKYIEGPEYQQDRLMLIGYDHSIAGFSLAILKISEEWIISGQNADTIGFFGPSEGLKFDSYGPRNLKMLARRIKLSKVICDGSKDFVNSYSRIYNDRDYRFNSLRLSESELKVANKIKNLVHGRSTAHIWYGLLASKMRAFGTGSDLAVQRIIAEKYGKVIAFPLNCLPFAELARRNRERSKILWYLFPKHWYFGLKQLSFFDTSLGHYGYRDYSKTPRYRAMVLARQKFVNSISDLK